MDVPVRGAHPHGDPHLALVAVRCHLLHRRHALLLLRGLCFWMAGQVRQRRSSLAFSSGLEGIRCFYPDGFMKLSLWNTVLWDGADRTGCSSLILHSTLTVTFRGWFPSVPMVAQITQSKPQDFLEIWNKLHKVWIHEQRFKKYTFLLPEWHTYFAASCSQSPYIQMKGLIFHVYMDRSCRLMKSEVGREFVWSIFS